MSANLLECVEVGPDRASYSVIWLHGLGADGYDFEPIVSELQFTSKPQTRFVFPHAPIRPVTVNAGMRMRAWYDIVGIDESSPDDEAGIRDSAQRIAALIQEQGRRGVPAERIALAGFSQGGAMALHVGLRHVPYVRGILALSAYLPLRDGLADDLPVPPPMPAIFMAHGEADPVVPVTLAQISKALLEQRGYTVDWHSYPMDHAVIPAEIEDISAWLDKQLR